MTQQPPPPPPPRRRHTRRQPPAPLTPVLVRIGDYVFDHASYDRDGDVLYLHIGPPRAAADAEETPEGHAVRYDAEGRVIGLTLINARWLVERDGALTVTIPPLRAGREALAPALGLAS